MYKEFFKYYFRYLLQMPSIYRPNGSPHIFLFSTRRSGSTLLRDLIYTQPGFNYVDQPFDKWQYNPHKSYLPFTEKSQLISLNSTESEKLQNYIQHVLQGNYLIRSQWQVWRKEYHWIWNRYVLKILNAKAMIHWFEDKFGATSKIVYMVRHPVPTAISIMNRGWDTTSEAYLNDEFFLQNYVNGRQSDFSWNIIKKGTLLEKHVLNWCLENLVPLRDWQDSDWFTISYENLLANPVMSTERICRELSLPDPSKMVKAMKLPTRTAIRASKKTIINEGPGAKLGAWYERMKNEMDSLYKVANILDVFEINLYSIDSWLPHTGFDNN